MKNAITIFFAVAAAVATATAVGADIYEPDFADGSGVDLIDSRDATLVVEPEDGPDPLSAIVKLEVQTSEPDFVLPWRTDIGGGDGSGVVIGNGRILTCAHCVANSTYIRVRKNNEDSLYHATIEAIDNDRDLATIIVSDPEFMSDIVPLEIGETPRVQADVLAVGYPMGGYGISFTRGIVSRIEDRMYSHGLNRLLAVQIDAAINPGNSGGPVLDLETMKIAGIAFQGDRRGEALGYMIPTEIIRMFLEDAKDGTVDGVPDIPFEIRTLESKVARRCLGMKPGDTGILITEIQGNTNSSPLRVGDVLMSIGGYNIANNGNVRIEGNEIREPTYAFYMRQIGDVVPATILRDGEPLEIEIPVQKFDFKIRRLMFGRAPDWYVYGGLVFTTTSFNYVLSQRPDLNDDLVAPKEFPDEEPVIISSILPDVCVEGYLGAAEEGVRMVNGEKVRNLRHLVSILENTTEGFVKFELDAGGEWNDVVIVDAAEMREATPRVLERYAIPADRSRDLK